MGIKVVTYGGKIGWALRTRFSGVTSGLYLNTQYAFRKSLFKKYIDHFNRTGGKEQPCLVSIETINRCNSTCDFCPANRNAETRPFMRMEEDLFRKIIAELRDWDYAGYLNLYVNNEPLMDKDIEDRYAYAKQMLPKAKMLLYTNGLLMTKERFLKLAPVVDTMIINNYAETLKLHKNIAEIYEFAKNDPTLREKDITIQIRYIHEILSNRAGSAPNRKAMKTQHKICVMPFTDMTIYPDGRCGLCCSDVLEQTTLGDCTKETLQEIWANPRYQKTREVIGRDREDWPFCRGCDFVDSGIRNTFMNSKMLF